MYFMPSPKPPKPKKKSADPEHKRKVFKQQFLSQNRREFIGRSSCTVPWCEAGHCDNAHIANKSGMGKKGDYTDIVPLCRMHHIEYDTQRERFYLAYGLSPELMRDAAGAIEIAWRASCGDHSL